jgi:arginase family enzyme
MKTSLGCFLLIMLIPCLVMSQKTEDSTEAKNIFLVKMPYSGARNVAELSPSPDYLANGGITEIIYVHIDMDVLDPREVSGHGLTVPGGPSSQELAAALTLMFSYPKVAALGIASTPSGEKDPGQLSRQAAYNLIAGAIRGLQQR